MISRSEGIYMKKLICGSKSPTPSSKEGEQEATLQFPPLASRKNLHEMIYVASRKNLFQMPISLSLRGDVGEDDLTRGPIRDFRVRVHIPISLLNRIMRRFSFREIVSGHLS